MQFSCSIPLPETFRPGDILAFHRRDRQEIAERVSNACLQKAMIWCEAPAYLSINFESGLAKASRDRWQSDPGLQPIFEHMVRRMLGLTQGVEIFEEQYRDHRN
jgi:DNA-3-methyladenine glycosylase II